MAGQIEITVALDSMRTMSREVPVTLDLEDALSTCTGYVSATDISFDYVKGACLISSVAAGLISTKHFTDDHEQILVSSSGGTNSGVNDGLYTKESMAEGVITLHEDDVVVTQNVAEAGTVVIYGVQVYNITPTRKTENLLIVYSEGLEAGGETGMIPCVLNGDFWAANEGLYTAFAATTVSGTPHGTFYLWIPTAKYMNSSGTIKVMLVPKATKELYSDHRPALGFLELP